MTRLLLCLALFASCCFSTVLNGQIVLFSYSFEGGLDDPDPSSLLAPTFTEEGTLTTPSFFTGPPLLSACTGTTGLSRSNAGWNTGEAYRFTVDVTGYNTMGIAYCTRASAVGVGNFSCRVSCDGGGSWSTIIPSYALTTSFSPRAGMIPVGCDDAAELLIEIYKENEPLATGNNIRIDNVVLAGLANLPIELVDFTANEKSGKVELDWTTATETNCDYFSVERSLDGINFYEIGKIAAAGNSTGMKNYSMMDEEPVTGINYYRLHQVDFDGKSSNGPVKSVYFGSNSTLSIFPSLTSNEVTVKLNDNKIHLGNARVEVFDMYGQLVRSLPFRDDLKFDVSTLTGGTYVVKLTDDQLIFTGSFIKI